MSVFFFLWPSMYHLFQYSKSKLTLNKLEEICLSYELSFALCDSIKTRGFELSL